MHIEPYIRNIQYASKAVKSFLFERTIDRLVLKAILGHLDDIVVCCVSLNCNNIPIFNRMLLYNNISGVVPNFRNISRNYSFSLINPTHLRNINPYSFVVASNSIRTTIEQAAGSEWKNEKG